MPRFKPKYLPGNCGAEFGRNRLEHLRFHIWVHVDHLAIAAAVATPQQTHADRIILAEAKNTKVTHI